ncbi:MAG: hypothetical protein ABH952_07540 [Candidatus Omnitrophota bacterium]
MSLTGETSYDQSKANPGKVAGTLFATTTTEIGAKAKAAWVFRVELEGKATLSASGQLALQAKDINANYAVGVTDVTVSGSIVVDTFAGERGIWEGSHDFDWNASKSGTVKLYSFK